MLSANDAGGGPETGMPVGMTLMSNLTLCIQTRSLISNHRVVKNGSSYQSYQPTCIVAHGPPSISHSSCKMITHCNQTSTKYTIKHCSVCAHYRYSPDNKKMLPNQQNDLAVQRTCSRWYRVAVGTAAYSSQLRAQISKTYSQFKVLQQ